jgi:hypothetical protein
MSLLPGMVGWGCGFDSQETMKEAGGPDWHDVPGTYGQEISLGGGTCSKKKQPLFSRETVRPGLLTLALLII